MEFIKQMKKREFIEMGLKAFAALLAAFLAIILMEGMIYGIKLNSIINPKTPISNILTQENKSTVYCFNEEDGLYTVVYHTGIEGYTPWIAYRKRLSLEDIQNPEFATFVKDVKMRPPNAFELSITGTHYIVMAVFIAGIAGFFTYKFISLNKSYKKVEENFLKTGAIELG